MSSTPISGRLLLALALAAVAALPTAAQDRFAATCVASATAEAPAGIDGPAICGCAVAGAIARGVTGADLDAAVPILEGQVETASESVAAAATIAAETLAVCAIESLAGSTLTGAPTGVVGVAASATINGQTISGATPPARLPQGLSTGNGTGTAQGRQTGKGTPIRITGR